MGTYRGWSILDQWKVKGRREGVRWRVRARDPISRKYASRCFDDRAEAERWARAMRHRLAARVETVGKLSLETLGQDHLCDLQRRGRTEKHMSDVRLTLEQVAGFGIRDLRDKDLRRRVRAWLDSLSNAHPCKAGRAVTARCRNKKLIHLKGLVNFAIGEELLDRDVLLGVRVETDPAEKRQREVFSPTELAAMVSETWRDDPYWLGACCLVYLGLRLGELYALRWSWFDWVGNCVNVRQEVDFSPKRHQERRIPLLAEIRDILYPIAGIGEARIVADGRQMKESWHSRLFVRYLQRIGLDPAGRGAHCVRHSWVSLRLALGVPSLVVQREAGHSSIMTTEKYTHALPAGWLKDWPKGGEFHLRRQIACPTESRTVDGTA